MPTALQLDWEKERLVANKLLSASKMLKTQITAFLNQLDEIEI